jgi:hypothetical protein
MPDGWVLLPRPEGLAAAPPVNGKWDKLSWELSEDWARVTAAELLGLRKPAKRKGQNPRSAEYRLGEQLLVHLRLMWELRPIGSAVLVPDPEDGVLAVMTVTRVETSSEDLLAEVRAVKGLTDPHLLGPRTLSDATLPMGPAVRVHETFDNDPSLPGGQPVEGVSYFVAITGTDHLVELAVQWTDFAIGEDLADHAKMIAESLEFVAL